jgi:hypothetical protein
MNPRWALSNEFLLLQTSQTSCAYLGKGVRILSSNETYKSPIGMKKEPKKSAGMRISGFPTPPFLSASLQKTNQLDSTNENHTYL